MLPLPLLLLPPPPPLLPQVNGRLRELHTTLEAGDRLREGVLQAISLNLDAWGIQVRCAVWCGVVRGVLHGPHGLARQVAVSR